ncbi:MAG TPA: hypothetical protein VI895_05230 [Bdellovibrionota bacterium]|nr:hypothetical protein [Bdellovibrionota bacterium]
MTDKKAVLLNAAIAGLLLSSFGGTVTAHAADDRCYGINACKGTGDCGGKGYSCAGNNECKGKGWLKIEAETCKRIQGSSPSPLDEKSGVKKQEKKT